jgi:cellulose biosynthesis protein BcsQ
MTVVSLINLKGGVAKTTTTVQLAECLASEFGKKVHRPRPADKCDNFAGR